MPEDHAPEAPEINLSLTAEGWRITDHAPTHNGDNQSAYSGRLTDVCERYNEAMNLIHDHAVEDHGVARWADHSCTRVLAAVAAAAFLSNYLDAEFSR